MAARISRVGQKRRSRDALRALVLDAAADLLLADGPGIGAENLTYKRVFDHLEETQGIRLTRSSVHGRIWADQAEFQRDAVHQAASFVTTHFVDGAAAVAERLDNEPDGHEGRAEREMLLVAQAAGQKSHDGTLLHWLRLAASAALGDQDDGAIASARDGLTTSYVEQFAMAETWAREYLAAGLVKPRPELFGDGPDGVDRIVALAARVGVALDEGDLIRRHLDPEGQASKGYGVPGQPDDERYTPFSIGLLAQLQYLTVPVEEGLDGSAER